MGKGNAVSTAGSGIGQLSAQVRTISSHANGIAEGVKAVAQSVQGAMRDQNEPTADILASSAALVQCLTSSTAALQDCLGDLATMVDAMAPVLASDPETAQALMINLYTTFARQLSAYYRDMSGAFTQSTKSIDSGRTAYHRESPGISPTSTNVGGRMPSPAADNRAPTPQPAPTSTTHVPAGVEGEENEAEHARPAKKKKKTTAAAAAVGDDGMVPNSGDVPSTGRPKKKKVSLNAAEVEAEMADEAATAGADPFAAAATSNSPALQAELGGSPEDMELAALNAAAAAGASGKTKKAKKKSLTSTAVVPSGYTPPQHEPLYLPVTSTVEDALGKLVIASRPDVFTNVNLMTSRAPVATYYIQLVRPGSLAQLVVANYINVDEEAQADLFCDVLETDCVEMEPFESTSGEVYVGDESNLSTLPVCAWRQGNSEDHTRLLYTMYTLVHRPSPNGPAALVQDSFSTSEGNREEVLHVFGLLEQAPQYVMVTVYSSSSNTATGSQPRSMPGGAKAAAIASFTRSGLGQRGFAEVSEADIAAVTQQQAQSKRELRQRQLSLNQASSHVDATESFQPHVQLASLDQPAPRQGPNFGDVAKGAMRGGMEVLKAPFTVSKVVGGAVLGVTGVTDAVRNSIEGVYRKAFPRFAEEPIIESYNAAWVEGGIPKQGYLFITPQRLCFSSTVANAEFTLEYDEIKDVQKAKSAKVFDNAVDITNHLNEHFFIINLLQRDQTYSIIMKQWMQ